MSDQGDFFEEEDSGDKEPDISELVLQQLREHQANKPPDRKVDFSSFREESKTPWEDIAGTDELTKALPELLRKTILLPRSKFQSPIALSYLMIPSALSNRVPILFSQGMSGCGKSKLGELACRLHGISPISASSTFASIRNAIASCRVWDGERALESPGNEKNAALVWEDIEPSSLSGDNSNIFALLKNGVERTGTITIADAMGKNKVFKVFCPKYASSIHPIYAQYDFRELVRRIIVVQHKPRQLWLSNEFEDSEENLEIGDLVDTAEISWENFNTSFLNFWETHHNLEEWARIARSLNGVRSHGMNANDYRMSKDLITCGTLCGYWSDTKSAINHMRDYWDWHKSSIESQASAMQLALQLFIADRTRTTIEQNEKFVELKMQYLVQPLEIDAKSLKIYIDSLRSNGQLDKNGSTYEINSCMNALGWELRPNSQRQNTWQPING